MARKMICRTSDVPANGLKECEGEGGLKLLIANSGSDYFAVQAICPHQEVPLCEGMYDGTVLTCHQHLWQWDIRTGAPMGIAEAPLERYEVTVEGDAIYVGSQDALNVGELFHGIAAGTMQALTALAKREDFPAGSMLYRPGDPARDLFVLDSGRVEFLLGRTEKHKARLVCFSPVDTRTLAEKHEFDAELAARLAELTLKLPALRELAEDVPDLASLMLAQLVESRTCPPRRLAIAALNALRHHSWPGNLAELQSVVKDLALGALDEEVRLEDVERVLAARSAPGAAPEIALDRPYREAREAFERIYFENLLAREHGSMSRVAERSGLERTHLYRKLKALGLPVGRREES